MPLSDHTKTSHARTPECTRVRRVVLAWAVEHPHRYPWRRAETSNWGKLVAEVMLQRTTASRVMPIWAEFISRFPEPSDAAARRAEVLRLMEPLGLRKRAASLVDLSEVIETLGSIPDERARLLELPGVGVYTADAFLCFAHGRCEVLVDSNISRLVHRLAGRAPERQAHRTAATRRAVKRLVGGKASTELMYALLDFTIDICRPLPLCDACPVGHAKLCQYGLLVSDGVHDRHTEDHQREE